MSIVDKLNYLLETKNVIKNALIDKGVEVLNTDTFRSYANKIATIQSGGTQKPIVLGIEDNGSYEYNVLITFINISQISEITLTQGGTVLYIRNKNFRIEDDPRLILNEDGSATFLATGGGKLIAKDQNDNVISEVTFEVTGGLPIIYYSKNNSTFTPMIDGYGSSSKLYISFNKGSISYFSKNRDENFINEYTDGEILGDGEYFIRVETEDGVFVEQVFIIESTAITISGVTALKTYDYIPQITFTNFNIVYTATLTNTTTGEVIDLLEDGNIEISEDGKTAVTTLTKLENGTHIFYAATEHRLKSIQRSFTINISESGVE